MKLPLVDLLPLVALASLVFVLSGPFVAAGRAPGMAGAIEAAPSDRRKVPGAELTEVIFEKVREGDRDSIALYLESDYSPNAVNRRGDSLLVLASYRGEEAIVALLLEQEGIEVDHRNGMGLTALTGASFKGHTGIMRRLLAAGADANHRNLRGQTALMFAALTGRTEAVKLLRAHRADPGVVDTSGQSALSLARGQGAVDVIGLLK